MVRRRQGAVRRWLTHRRRGPDFGRYRSRIERGFSVAYLFLRLTHHLAEADLAVIDANVEATTRIGAYPGFERDRRAVPSIVREWDQDSGIALSAVGQLHFHETNSSPHTGFLRTPGDFCARRAASSIVRFRQTGCQVKSRFFNGLAAL